MSIPDTRYYAFGTSLTVRHPWGLFVAGRAMCSDGKVRSLKRISATADTFFSVPAAVTVNGKTVSGYITVESAAGFSTDTPTDPAVVKFVAYSYGRNGGLLPDGKWTPNPGPFLDADELAYALHDGWVDTPGLGW